MVCIGRHFVQLNITTDNSKWRRSDTFRFLNREDEEQNGAWNMKKDGHFLERIYSETGKTPGSDSFTPKQC